MEQSQSLKLQKLYELYEQPMYRIAYAVLHDTALAEDAVHDAFVRLVSRLEKIGEPDSPKTKGYIVKVSDIDTSGTYGNATYLISDRQDGATGTFQIYRGYGVNGQKFNEKGATLIEAGQEVLIKGKVINYQGNTPQFAQGSTIVSLK